MAMRLNEDLDDNGEMHEINVTPFIDVMPINPFQLIFGKAQVIQRLNILFQLFRPTRTNQH
jgi:Biopolymer transport protein